MGMTIEERIAQLVRVKRYAAPRHYETLDLAIDTMRKYQLMQTDYENRLKADMVAMLEELNFEIDEMFVGRIDYTVDKIQDLIQQKINALKSEIESQESEDNNNDV